MLYCRPSENTVCTMRSLPIHIDSVSIVKEPYGMCHSITNFLASLQLRMNEFQSVEVGLLKYRTEPTFRYLIVGIRYFSVFQIPTSISISFF